MSAISDLFAAGGTVQADLLTEVPSNTDMAEWRTVPWKGYRAAQVPIRVRQNQLPSGLLWDFILSFTPPAGSWPIAAVGLSYQGTVLSVAILPPGAVAVGGSVFSVRVDGFLQPVL